VAAVVVADGAEEDLVVVEVVGEVAVVDGAEAEEETAVIEEIVATAAGRFAITKS
jgi:hypothetical protein